MFFVKIYLSLLFGWALVCPLLIDVRAYNVFLPVFMHSRNFRRRCASVVPSPGTGALSVCPLRMSTIAGSWCNVGYGVLFVEFWLQYFRIYHGSAQVEIRSDFSSGSLILPGCTLLRLRRGRRSVGLSGRFCCFSDICGSSGLYHAGTCAFFAGVDVPTLFCLCTMFHSGAGNRGFPWCRFFGG